MSTPRAPQIRQARPSDAGGIHDTHVHAILELGRTAYSEAECVSWANGLTPDLYAHAITKGDEHFLVAEDATGICGFCTFKGNEIIGLYIHPRASRQGHATHLLAAAEARIASAGLSRVRLSAALSALDFYLSHGYRVLESKLWQTRGGLEIQIKDMEKSLTKS